MYTRGGELQYAHGGRDPGQRGQACCVPRGTAAKCCAGVLYNGHMHRMALESSHMAVRLPEIPQPTHVHWGGSPGMAASPG